MTLHPNFIHFGNIQILETYEFYDKPLLFSCTNQVGSLYLAVLANETEVGEDWLYVAISNRRLEEIRSGRIDLHDAFANAENGNLYQVQLPHDQQAEVEVSILHTTELTDDVLPLRGERLDLQVQTLPSVTPLEKLKISAAQSWREHITLRLTLPNQRSTEAPAQLLGEVLQKFQSLLNAITISLHENSITQSKRIHIYPQVNVHRFAHGSFAVELVSEASVDLLGYSETGNALEQAVALIESKDNSEHLKAKIETLKPRVAVNYALFLKALESKVATTQIDWASPKKETIRSTIITLDQTKNAIAIINKTDLQPPIEIQVAGVLIGANLRSKSFEISTSGNGRQKKYSGRIDDNALDDVKKVTLGHKCTGRIRETLVINYATEHAEPKYTLLSLIPE